MIHIDGTVTCDRCLDAICGGRGVSHPEDVRHRELCEDCYNLFDLEQRLLALIPVNGPPPEPVI